MTALREDIPKEAIEAARGYEDLLVPALLAPWPEHMVRGAALAGGETVLDVACGTGLLARHVRGRIGEAGRITGLDPAPGMLAVAAEIEPSITWVPGAAEDLPFRDDSFDAVLCQFGMMFFADLEAAAGEMFRVARPGGRLAVAVWNSLDHNLAYRSVVALLHDRVSREAGDAVALPFRLGAAGTVAEVLAGAGFEAVTVQTRSEEGRFPSAKTMVETELRGWLPMFDIHLEEGAIAELLAAADAALKDHVTPSGEVVFRSSAHIVTARKGGG